MKVLIAMIVLPMLSLAQIPSTADDLERSLRAIMDTAGGTYALAFIDLQTGAEVVINEREQFHAASTMKTPVMIEVFRQASEGKFALDDSVEVKNSFRSIIDGSEYRLEIGSDSEDGLYGRIGQHESVRSLVGKMITVSSNLATNILIGIVGPENIMRTMRGIGCNDIRVLRGVEDGKAFEAGKNNTTTAWDLAVIFRALAQKSIVSHTASEDMLRILKAQKFKDMIPARLPSSVIVAHKTGSITNVQHDSGIIMLPDGRSYVLVILSKNLPSNKEGIDVIATLSKAVYDHVIR